MAAHEPRRFKSLKQAQTSGTGKTLRGIVFDVDGTLCLPQNYMFGQMRAALAIEKSVDILDHIYELPTEEERDEAHRKIKDIEREAMKSQQPQKGLVELMEYLGEKGVRKGICTRNFDAPVAHLLDTFLPGHVFSPIITRSFRPPKPDPAGILKIASEWAAADGWSMPDITAPPRAASQLSSSNSGTTPSASEKSKDAALDQPLLNPATATSAALRSLVNVKQGQELDIIMVGDSVDDMTAGYRAGAATVLLVNAENKHLAEHEHTDLVVERLSDLIAILDEGFVGKKR